MQLPDRNANATEPRILHRLWVDLPSIGETASHHASSRARANRLQISESMQPRNPILRSCMEHSTVKGVTTDTSNTEGLTHISGQYRYDFPGGACTHRFYFTLFPIPTTNLMHEAPMDLQHRGGHDLPAALVKDLPCAEDTLLVAVEHKAKQNCT